MANTKRTKLVNGYETRAEGFMHLMDLAVAYGTRHDVDFVQYLQEMDARKAMSNSDKSKAKSSDVWNKEFDFLKKYMNGTVTVKELVKAVNDTNWSSSKVASVLNHFKDNGVLVDRGSKPNQYTLTE